MIRTYCRKFQIGIQIGILTGLDLPESFLNPGRAEMLLLRKSKCIGIRLALGQVRLFFVIDARLFKYLNPFLKYKVGLLQFH